MTVAENVARLFPLHYQRIVEIAHERGTQHALRWPSQGRWHDLAGLFIWGGTEEGFWYWHALTTGLGVRS